MTTIPQDLPLPLALGRSFNAHLSAPPLKPVGTRMRPSNQTAAQSLINALSWAGSRSLRTPDLSSTHRFPADRRLSPISLACTTTPRPHRSTRSESLSQGRTWYPDFTQCSAPGLSVRPSGVTRNPATCVHAASSRQPLQSLHYRPHQIRGGGRVCVPPANGCAESEPHQ